MNYQFLIQLQMQLKIPNFHVKSTLLFRVEFKTIEYKNSTTKNALN